MSANAAQGARCALCRHFRNAPRDLEREFPGLRSLGSAYGSTRAEDGLCDLQGLYVSSRHGCAHFRPAASRRAFVALLPDDAARDRLAALTDRFAGEFPTGQPVDPGNLHLTLAFLGATPGNDARRLLPELARISPPKESWPIDRIDSFPGPRVLWAGGPAPPGLIALAAEVSTLLVRLGISCDRRPFAAHVTLMRRAPAFASRPLAPPIAWPLDRPVLMESTRDPDGRLRYRPWTQGGD